MKSLVMKSLSLGGFSPELIGLEGEKISLPFLKRTRKGTHSSKGPHTGIDISCSNIKKPFNAGIHGLIISTQKLTGTITLIPFGKDSTIEYLNCSSFIKETGVVSPWTKIGVTGKFPTDSESSEPFLHLQIYEEGKPPYRQWQHNFVDPEKYIFNNVMIGTWLNHSESLNENGFKSIIKDSIIKIDSSEIGSHFPYFYHVQADTQNGKVDIVAEWDCTTINYTDIGINCYCKFIKCTGNIGCQATDFKMEIHLNNLDILSGSTIAGKPAVFVRNN